jgi:diguanylate cyclase (GGDEF)-like protein
MNPSILKAGRHDRDFYKTMWSSLLQNGEWRGEIWGRRKNGEVFPKWQTIRAVRDASGRLTHYMSVFSDVSHIKESEEKLHHLAHHDALTGLPNRLLLNARLEHSLQHAQRAGTKVAVLFVDLDHFKKVNDSFGHSVGDRLLQLVAERLLGCVRGEDTVARLGGDELTIVLGSLMDARYAATVAQEILDKLSEPFELQGQDVFVSASIGISTYPEDGRDVTALLKNADAAMYMAKSEGRNGYQFYSKELTLGACESLALEADLHRALERDELFLHFQPQVSLRSGKIVGVEALVRWRHPEMGVVSPARFIPLAEENGLIAAIGKWVLHTACTQVKAWQNDGLAPFRIVVNLSGRQLAQSKFVQEVRDVLEDTGLDPSHLELELTESSLMKQEERVARTLDALRALGTTISIDDFGTGYSSLSYLKRFPFDRLKIDRSFMRDIPQNSNDVAFAKAIVALGHSLNLGVVAEGVATQAQRELLTSIGCDEMQGFLYSAPRTASELAPLLSARTRSVCVND